MITRRLGSARAVWTDRHGGVSVAPFNSLNLGDHVGDAVAAMEENRALLARRLDLGSPAQWRFLQQVHGAAVVTVDRAPDGRGPTPAADGAVTALPCVPLVVLTADCAPVAIANDTAVGVVHVGWQGLRAGVVAAAVEALRAIGSGPVRAEIGPCIRPERYEFGRTDLNDLVAEFGTEVEGLTREGSPAFDLAAGVRIAFARCGVADVDDHGHCTAADTNYFSHRRDGVTGRQAVVVILE